MRPRTLVSLVGLALVLLGGPGCGSTDVPPPPDPSTMVALRPGERVLAMARGRAEEGNIVHVLSPTHVVVKFDADGAEEIILAERLQRPPTRAPSVLYRQGEVLVLSLPQVKRFVLAEILGPVGAKYRVRYLGFEPPAFEDVPVERLKRPHDGPSPHKAGEIVLAKADSGKDMKASIAAVLGPSLWLVHFDGFGPQYDQVLGPDRLGEWSPPQPPPPPAPVGPTFSAGQSVLAHVRGVFQPGSVVGPGASAGTFLVKFESGKLGQQDVAATELVLAKELAKGQKLAGASVLVEVHGVWLPGKVIKESGKGVQVRFDGEPPTSDEVVPMKRVRAKPDEGLRARPDAGPKHSAKDPF